MKSTIYILPIPVLPSTPFRASPSQEGQLMVTPSLGISQTELWLDRNTNETDFCCDRTDSSFATVLKIFVKLN